MGQRLHLPFPFPIAAWIRQCDVGLHIWFAAPLLLNLRAAPTIYSGMDQL
jgi:hypothetical protein